jgi:hypothetical protein
VPEFQIKVVNSNGVVVASTYITGDSKEDVLTDIAGIVDDAQEGESDWADGLDEEF